MDKNSFYLWVRKILGPLTLAVPAFWPPAASQAPAAAAQRDDPPRPSPPPPPPVLAQLLELDPETSPDDYWVLNRATMSWGWDVKAILDDTAIEKEEQLIPQLADLSWRHAY